MLRERIKKIYLYRHILWDMSFKQFKSKYAGSKLGFWWAILIPLILAVSINFVFSLGFKINIPNYTYFLLAGIMPWLFFSNALGEATNSFLVNSSVIKQGMFPPEFIPISTILANLFNFFIGLVFLAPLFIIFNFAVLKFLPLLLLTIILHFFFIAGIGLIFSYVNILFRDLSHFLSIGFMIWFWLTPIFYYFENIPSPLNWVCLFNPMTYYIVLYQDALFKLKAPQFFIISISFLISFLSFNFGYAFFIKKESILLKNI